MPASPAKPPTLACATPRWRVFARWTIATLSALLCIAIIILMWRSREHIDGARIDIARGSATDAKYSPPAQLSSIQCIRFTSSHGELGLELTTRWYLQPDSDLAGRPMFFSHRHADNVPQPPRLGRVARFAVPGEQREVITEESLEWLASGRLIEKPLHRDQQIHLSWNETAPRITILGVELTYTDQFGHNGFTIILPHWYLLLLCALPPVWLSSRLICPLLLRRLRSSRCSKCRYDFAGLAPSGACPECGTPRPT